MLLCHIPLQRGTAPACCLVVHFLASRLELQITWHARLACLLASCSSEQAAPPGRLAAASWRRAQLGQLSWNSLCGARGVDRLLLHIPAHVLRIPALSSVSCPHLSRVAPTQSLLPPKRADDGSLTLEEWEAQRAAAQAAPAGPSQQQLSDEELARQLQRQLDLEAAQEWAANAEVGGRDACRRCDNAASAGMVCCCGCRRRLLLLDGGALAGAEGRTSPAW